jgi:hypothetical protein
MPWAALAGAVSAVPAASFCSAIEVVSPLCPVVGRMSESVLLHPSSTDQYFRELQREKAIKTLGIW